MKSVSLKVILLVAVLLCSTHLFGQEYGLKERIPNTSFLLSTAGDTLAEMDVVRAFTNLSFVQPVFLTYAPDGSDRIFVVEKRGIIRVFDNQADVPSSKIFLDISAQVTSGYSESGLLSMAFHPDFPDSNTFYVYYNTGDLISRISEFNVSANPDSADQNSERILLTVTQPATNHNGGQLNFGPDGYLYISLGDGGGGGDTYHNGQDRSTLLGAILRIDIDHQVDTLEYAIPVDNPFAGNTDGWREEIWAWGLRNPWRFSFDRLTGQLWVGDVGQGTWEEVDIIEGGKNYGWNIMEGFHCYPPGSGCDTTGLTLPIAEYDHGAGRSITGGYVYRGVQYPWMHGVYIYGDYSTGTIWGLRYEEGQVTENKVFAEIPATLSSFGEDEAGEIYLLGYVNGIIYRFAEKSGTNPPTSIPLTIATSGLFSDIATFTASPGLIPYTINAPFWSDNALKERLIALPDTSKIVFSEDSTWQFPPNAVLVKNFFLETERGNPQSKKIIETRFLVRYADKEQWDGFSYLWNDEETDAVLLDSSYIRPIMITDGDSSYIQNYYYPSRSECKVCHNAAAGFVLGLRTAQMNKQHLYINEPDSVWDNQLRSYNHIRLFTEDIGEDYTGFPKMADPFDENIDVETRARAYLDANCANCHRPGSSGRTDMDLRYDIPLEAAHIVDVAPELDDMGITGAQRIKPGSADSSLVYLRMLDLGAYRMPPLASSVIDVRGADLIRSWIDSLGVALSMRDYSETVTPSKYELYPAYPNPFNAVTTIAYQLPEVARVVLIVYDIRGREVITLVKEQQPAGEYKVRWQADTFSSGVYFYRLQTEKFNQVRKLVLLK